VSRETCDVYTTGIQYFTRNNISIFPSKIIAEKRYRKTCPSVIVCVTHVSLTHVQAAQVDVLCALAERGISGGESDNCDCDGGIVAVAAAASPHRAWCAEIKAIGLQPEYARASFMIHAFVICVYTYTRTLTCVGARNCS
jgi:hypothetical protein